MKRFFSSEKLLIEEVTQIAEKAKAVCRTLSIGYLIKMIRTQLGMSQKFLAKRAGVPQSTISRIEMEKTLPNLNTVNKVLDALSCDLVMVPLLRESIQTIRQKQARKQAENHIRYLKGTMSLEDQQPDSKLLEELLKQEEGRLLNGPDSELWRD